MGKISPFFRFGIILLTCCISIVQNKSDLAPTSVSYDLRDGHGKTLYIENAIEQVGKKLLLPKSWQDSVDKIEEVRTNLDEDTDEFGSPKYVLVRSKRSPLPKKKKGEKKNNDDEEDEDDDDMITTTTQDPEDEQSSTAST